MSKTLIINLFGGPAAGKCFRKGTKIFMFDGSIKNVEEININDKLMGPDSKERTVLNLSNGISNMFEVAPMKGNPFYVTENHVLPLKLNHHGREKSENYTVSEFRKLSKWRQERLKLFRAPCIEFPEIETPIDPYFIGCWLGDGNNADQGVTSIDGEIINYIENLAYKNEMHVTRVKKDGTDALRCNITNGHTGGKPNKILDVLRELNLLNNKHIPKIYKINSKKNRLKLLAGLIDTDGNINRNSLEITTKYKNLSEDIQFICKSLGYAAYEHEKKVNNKIYYRINIGGNLENIPILLKRKKCKPRKSVKNVLRTSFSVNLVGLEKFYGFEVNRDHLFLLSDFTVVHNSTMAAGVFCLLKMHGMNCELVTEFAKDLVWEERYNTLKNQQYVFAKQYHKMWRLLDKVDVIITDSPLLLSVVYMPKDCVLSFINNVVDTINTLDNLNIILNRDDGYDENGRLQNKEQAKKVDAKIKRKLLLHDMDWIDLQADYNSINYLTSLILKKLDREGLDYYIEY